MNFIQYEIARVRAKPERRAIGIGLNEGRLNQSPIPARPCPLIVCYQFSVIINIHLNLETSSQAGTSAGDVLDEEDPGDPKYKLMESQDGLAVPETRRNKKKIASRRIAVLF